MNGVVGGQQSGEMWTNLIFCCGNAGGADAEKTNHPGPRTAT